MSKIDFGDYVEGIIEQDPINERYKIRTEKNGVPVTLDVGDLLQKYHQKGVRLILTPLESIGLIEKAVEAGGGTLGMVGLGPQDVPGGHIQVHKKPS